MSLARNGCRVAATLVVFNWGCSRFDSQQPDTSVVTGLHEELALDWVSRLAIPDADGDLLAPIEMEVPVLARPETGAPNVGYLRLGSRVPRSAEPVSKEDCPGGWYALRPVGFVCADDRVTDDLDHPLTRAIARGPDRSKPLPYSYAFLRAVAPNYLRVPPRAEQQKREMRLDRHLSNWQKFRSEWDQVSPGANDVPLADDGSASGEAPAQLAPPGFLERFGGHGDAGPPWWLDNGKRAVPNVSSFEAPPYSVMAGRVKRHAGVALIDAFKAGDEAGHRGFAITTDARLIPADKLKADSGSTFHGQAIRELGLPVAFGYKPGASWWKLREGKLERTRRLEPREFVGLTGKIRQLAGVRMVETVDGSWLRSSDLRTAPKPMKLPWFASGKRRWIQISLLNQTLVLWEGATPVYATLVSTGRDGMGDPKTTVSTPQGTFRIYAKHVTTTMDSNAADKEFELRDVPWVMYFNHGYALHGAYWHDDFGRPRSHGCVNLAPVDARYVFNWSSPDVPEAWHGSVAGETFGKGTLVHIEP